MISEIHCLSHPLHGLQSTPGEAERIHRHASRVRRVASERIGVERLHAYCERVGEAFEAYMHGGWGGPAPRTASTEEGGLETDAGDGDMDVLVGVVGDRDEGRGRSKERGDGSVMREIKPEKDKVLPPHLRGELEQDDPFADTMMGEEDELGMGFGTEGDLLRIDLDDVQEADETSSNEDKQSR